MGPSKRRDDGNVRLIFPQNGMHAPYRDDQGLRDGTVSLVPMAAQWPGRKHPLPCPKPGRAQHKSWHRHRACGSGQWRVPSVPGGRGNRRGFDGESQPGRRDWDTLPIVCPACWRWRSALKQHRARVLQAQSHEIRVLSVKWVRPLVRGNWNHTGTARVTPGPSGSLFGGPTVAPWKQRTRGRRRCRRCNALVSSRPYSVRRRSTDRAGQ